MGHAADYWCTACGHQAENVTDNFSFGFSGVVVTPVVCTEHGIVTADTGMNARDDGPLTHTEREFSCPMCGAMSPRWDRTTCPECGQKCMSVDPNGRDIMWD
jgi:DNA-directed RNA polymerase subunit RPC12/RpoP